MSGAFRRLAGVLLIALGLTGAGAVALAGPAGAHSALERSDPAAGESVDVLPEKITLNFNQSPLALGSRIRVTGPDGEVSAGDVEIKDQRVTQALDPGPAGEYTVLWRITSADGHPISGKFTFDADTGSAQPGPEPSATEASTEASTGASAPATSAPAQPAPQEEEPGEGGSGMVWLLVALAGLVLAAGLVLVLRRPGGPGGDSAEGSGSG